MIRRPLLLAVVLISLACGGGAAAAVVDSDRPAGRAAVVAVPRITGAYDLIDGYRRLRRAGLRMAIRQPFSLSSLCLASPGSQTPAAGTRAVRGATVTVGRLRCALASPAGDPRQVVVPDLTGRPASAAVSWAEHAGLDWQLDRLAPLAPSRRGELLENYVVIGQSPAAGATLGRATDCSTDATRCLRATPLRLRTRERPG